MYPPPQIYLDVSALSGILGSVSIACWVVVFSPQIVENFRRGSADGLSVVFIVIWLLGDIFNILGAILQGVLPTMVILAIYYTLADIVLLGQCFYYKGFTLSDEIKPVEDTESRQNERAPLLGNGTGNDSNHVLHPGQTERRTSFGSFRERMLSVDGTHLSPATPLRPDAPIEEPRRPAPTPAACQGILLNCVAIVMVCAAGVLGWWLSNNGDAVNDEPKYDPIVFNTWGQIFGYVCAVLYLGSRIPQLLLNYRRKSTEGISMLFFLFACIGNLTYVLSIVAYDPVCKKQRHCKPGETLHLYGRYIAMNFSWLLGSFGTLILDGLVFVQYFMYREDEEDESEEEDEDAEGAIESRVVHRRPGSRRREISFGGEAEAQSSG